MPQKTVLANKPIHVEALEKLEQKVNVVTCYSIPVNEILALLPKVHGVVLGTGLTMGGAEMDLAEKLEVIGRHGVGLDNVDVAAATERGIPVKVSRDSKLDWSEVREHVAAHGMRNSNVMAVAPTATISNIAGCYPCIEPIYKNLYVKANMSGEFTIINRYLVKYFRYFSVGIIRHPSVDFLQGGWISKIALSNPGIEIKFVGIDKSCFHRIILFNPD